MGIGFLGARYCTLVFRVDCGCLCEIWNFLFQLGEF